MNTVRQNIGKRLDLEFSRRALKPETVANAAGVDASVVTAYLDGSRTLNLRELSAICDTMGINPVRLLYSQKYTPARITFRSIGAKEQKAAAAIEDAFLLIKDFLPKTAAPKQRREVSLSRFDAITEAASAANRVLKDASTPEAFLEKYNVPVFAVKSEQDFDAFLLSVSSRTAICVNTHDKPPHRIRFSLAHEICHLIFDRDDQLAVDVLLPSELYKARLSKEHFPEFFAYKFAQFFLLPFDEVGTLATSWPTVSEKAAQELLDRQGASREVLCNAVLDAVNMLDKGASLHVMDAFHDDYRATSGDFARMDFESEAFQRTCPSGGRVSYETVAGRFAGLKPGRIGNETRTFLAGKKAEVATILGNNRDSFSDSILEHIKEVLQLELR